VTSTVLRTLALLALAVLVAAAAALHPAPVAATSLQRLSVAQLSRHAVAVVEGHVRSVRSETTASGVRTVVRLRVARAFKGPQRRSMTVVVPGGTLGDGSRMAVAGMPAFTVGERCIVFVDVYGRVVGGFQGAYDLEAGVVEATGEASAAFARRVQAALGAAVAPDADMSSGAGSQASSPRAARAAGAPVITSITPSAASAGTGSLVTISGSGFGDYGGSVLFPYGRNGTMTVASTFVQTWSDTAVVCEVPTAMIDDYAACAGTGAVVVSTSTGQRSNGYDFSVPFGYGGARWTGNRVVYRVDTSGVDDQLRTSLLDAGAGMWNALGAGFTFVDGGPINSGLSYDGINVISWADGMPYGVLATSYFFIDRGVVNEIDIEFSNAFPWGDGAAGSNTYDIQSTASHELGHWLVLLDQYMLADADKIMYGYENVNQQRRVPAPGDVAGIRWVYGGGSTPTPTPTPTASSSPTPTPTPTPTQTALDVGPVCGVKDATVRRGSIATIRYVVTDDLDLVVTRSISVSTTSGVVKKKWTGVTKSSAAWQSFRFRCDLKKGSYRLTVRAEDLAGHPASVVGRATLTVR
jgi:hypothetical protein